jgi:hypothetical protein
MDEGNAMTGTTIGESRPPGAIPGRGAVAAGVGPELGSTSQP